MTNMQPNGAPLIVPGNMSGTLAGAAATIAVGVLAHAGYLATAAAFIGCPEATVSVLAMAMIGGVVNYGVTHIAAIKSLNDLYAMLPSTYADYPGDKPLPSVVTNLRTKDGANVGQETP